MNTQRTRSRTGWLLASLALLALPALQAQSTATSPLTPGAARPDDEVIELTPFEVNAADDTGYRANSTLAGTRLRTDLRDVAASISVVTKDFMNDIAANNYADLLTYTAGTEVDGLSGNFSGSGFNSGGFQEFNNASRQPQNVTRVRGIGPADQTRDYFITDSPMDGYNIDRVEVMRGPNAILFGLGRPAGILNSGLIKALPNRTKTKVEFKFDQEGTQRYVLDHNQVLIKDVLAFRVAGLYSDERFRIEPAYIRDERLFATATWRPWKGAQLRLSAETADRYSAKPYTTTPMDSFTWWLALGKPVYNPTTGLGSYLGTPSTNPALQPFNPLTGASSPNAPNVPPFTSSTNRPGNLHSGINNANSLNVIAEDPNSSRLGITGLNPSIVAMELNNTRGRLTSTGAYANDGMRKLSSSQEYMRQTNTDKPLLYNFWKDFRIMDPNLFDFYHEMFEGPNKREWVFWDTFNTSFSQELGRHAGFELTYDKQKFESGFVQPLQFRQNTIAIDINTHLMNGMVNPNLGRPMDNTALGFQNSNSSEREAYRASAFYELDFTTMKKSWLAKLLGRHIMTGNYTGQTRETYSFGARLQEAGNDYQAAKLINSPADLPAATAANPNRVFNVGTGERAIVRTTYHGPSLVNATSLEGYSFQGVTAVQNIDGANTITALYYERPPNVTSPLPRPLGAWKTGTFGVLPQGKYDFRNVTTGGDHNYEKTISTAFVLNSYWWDETLVSTLGWRKDTFEGQNSPSPVFDGEGQKNLDPSVWILNPPQLFEATKFNWGLVLHMPPFLRGKLPLGADVSLTYNKSDNLSPTAQRYDIYDNPIDPPGGETEEWSVLLALFSNKLELRAIKYATSAARANAQFTEIQNRLVRRLENQTEIVRNTAYRDEVTLKGFGAELAAWDTWEKSSAAQTLFKTFRYEIPPGPYGASTPNILTQERIGEVLATQDVVAEGYEFDVTYNVTPQWRLSLNAAEQITINDNTGLEFRKMMDEIAPAWGGTIARLPLNIGTTNDLGTDYASINVDVQKQELLDGGVTPELRRWRFNAVTNYTFKGGKLNNVRIGGAYRWQDKAAIGFPIIVGPDGINGIIDVMNPYYGEAESNIDAWIGYSRVFGKKKIRWNIQLNVKNIGVGNELVAVSTQPTGIVDTARIVTPQTWSVTNTFEF